MSEFFLVLPAPQREIATLDETQTIRDGLTRHVPDKKFVVVRCKRWMQSAQHFPKMVELLRDILRDGLTAELRRRAEILLLTFGNRNETPHLKRKTVPEFQPRRPE